MEKNNNKHYKYKNSYKRDIVYWGLGIENEVYLEFEKSKKVKKDFLLNQKR